MEVAAGRHRLEAIARPERFVGPARERPALYFFDSHTQIGILLCGADRVGATHFLAVELLAKRQVLARLEAEQLPVLITWTQRDDDGITRIGPDVRHVQGIETGHRRPGAQIGLK